jgi:2-oxoisovalerate dehydrogenase E2 component (dihydrolipoyl transacylase)
MGLSTIRVPDIGEGVAQVEIVEWHVKPGDTVREDDVLAAVMTDKAMVEIPSLYTGRIVSLGAELGATVAVGSPLLTIEHEGGGRDPQPEAAPERPSPPADPEPRPEKAPVPPPVQAPARSAGSAHAPRPEGEAPLASPSVRARAREGGIDLRRVAGTGRGGRITHDDLDAVFARGPAPAPAAAGRQREGREEIPVIGLRRRIADRMALANARIPHITVVEEIDVTALEDLRAAMNDDRGDRPRLTMLPFLVAALVRALDRHPEMNAHFDDEGGRIIRHRPVHVGIATMTDNGLVVPVLRHAEALGPFATAAGIARLSEAARTGKATRDALSGSTITITSLGPLGALATTPIINHPDVAILGVNRMAVRPAWDGQQFVPRKMMNISASFDHRVIDGWDAASFVALMKRLLETPAMIFMEPEA